VSARAESSLDELLKRIEPERRDPHEFVYSAVPSGTPGQLQIDATCCIQELEGETLILRRAEAGRHNLAFTFPCRKIALRVHSSLQAVGFLARASAELAAHGISTNCVSAYYHDHLFVPAGDGERALFLLRQLQRLCAARQAKA
jgi:hypothetical protein